MIEWRYALCHLRAREHFWHNWRNPIGLIMKHPQRNSRRHRNKRAALMLEPPGKLRFITERLEAITERLEAGAIERLESDNTTELLKAHVTGGVVAQKAECPEADKAGQVESGNAGPLEPQIVESPPVALPPQPAWNPRWLRWAVLAALCLVALLGIGLYA